MNGSGMRKKVNGFVIHLDKLLGRGSYGQVYLCQQQATGAQYAAKIINKQLFQTTSNYLAASLRRQIEIHQKLNHPNIVRVVAAITTPHNYYVVQEYCGDGDLRGLMTRHPRFTEEQALYVIRCVCAGFQPLVQKGILHRCRDLKPENIVIRGSQLKITDFGFAKVMHSQRQMTRTIVGSPVYMSPQVLSQQPYSSKCDIWSVGVIFYELTVGTQPWRAERWQRLHQLILSKPQVKFPEECQLSQSSRTFIRMCLQYNQEDRLSWLQIYQQQFMGPELNQIGRQWRQAYELATQKLDWLRRNVQLQVLVGIFLSKRVSVMSYQLFGLVMSQLLPGLQQRLIGPMYQLFDKDNNGVIDFEQFVGGLSECPEEVLSVLTKLLAEGHYYQELKNAQRLRELCRQIQSQIIQDISYLIDCMVMPAQSS